MGYKSLVVAVVISLILLSTLFGTEIEQVAKANPLPYGHPDLPTVAISSPSNSTYSQNDIQVNATVVGPTELFGMAYHLDVVYYTLDNEVGGYLASNPSDGTQFSAVLTGLCRGEHKVTVHAYASGAYYGEADQIVPYDEDITQTVTFTVASDLNATQTFASGNAIAFPDGLTVYSPLNATYRSGILLCNVTFASSPGIQSSLNYSVDGVFQGYIIGAFNIGFNLSQLSDGPHQLAIGIKEGFSASPYPYDVSWFSRADTIYFSVDTSTPPASPSATPTASPTPTTSPTPTPSASPETPSPTPSPTLLIPNPFVTPPNSIGTPSEYPALIIAGIVVVVIAVVVLVYFRRR